jgi:hypothetical protein
LSCQVQEENTTITLIICDVSDIYSHNKKYMLEMEDYPLMYRLNIDLGLLSKMKASGIKKNSRIAAVAKITSIEKPAFRLYEPKGQDVVEITVSDQLIAFGELLDFRSLP